MCFKVVEQTILLNVVVKVNARESALLGINNDELQIALRAQPKEGEANKELQRFLAKLWDVPKTRILLRRGEASRHKQLSFPLTEQLVNTLNSL